ncbi:Oxidoreductase [Stigmatella aurantiaca DW4/3-1]|uniref:Oxidoreductase n=1 Tax=Stigmatella aurantiaca (strain DW4/3-1) TaxID=378806 RepID=E3FDH6_STIAD|nr:Oxidoreductase [Stigmatella aurantiaca DW4/3-1]
MTLSEEQAARLDAVSAVPLGFPHEMLAAEGLGLRIAGGKPELRKPPFAPAA